MEILTEILSIIGTVAFAVSGALVAIDGNLDIFGVCFVGCITAIGGGVLRDMMLGIHPPLSLETGEPCFIALGVSVAVFIIAVAMKRSFARLRNALAALNNFLDAVGLAAFSVAGVEVACAHGFEDKWFVAILSGMLTGICGGIFRDLLTSNTPSVLRKHVYALPSIVGSVIYWVIKDISGGVIIATAVSMTLMIATRLLAARFRWNLPRVRKDMYR